LADFREYFLKGIQLNKTHTNETQINKGLHWEQRDMTAAS